MRHYITPTGVDTGQCVLKPIVTFGPTTGPCTGNCHEFEWWLTYSHKLIIYYDAEWLNKPGKFRNSEWAVKDEALSIFQEDQTIMQIQIEAVSQAR